MSIEVLPIGLILQRAERYRAAAQAGHVAARAGAIPRPGVLTLQTGNGSLTRNALEARTTPPPRRATQVPAAPPIKASGPLRQPQRHFPGQRPGGAGTESTGGRHHAIQPEAL